MMKVLLINGSPNAKGNTALALGEMKAVFRAEGIETEIIAASIRTPMDVLDCAKVKADIATIPFGILKKMFKHPLTDRGIQQFKDDWAKAGM